MWHLKSVLESKNNENIVNFDLSSDFMKTQQSVYKLLERVNDSSMAIVVSEYIYNTNIKSGACEWQPELASNIRSSQKMFFPGVFSVIMSSNIDQHLRQVWNYMIATMCETGQIRSSPAHMVSSIMPMVTGQPYKERVCDNRLEKDQIISPFDWETFDIVFRLHAVMLLVPAVILLLEMHKKVKRHFVLPNCRCLFKNICFVILFPCMGVILLIISALSLCKKYPTAIASSVIRKKSTRTAPAVHE